MASGSGIVAKDVVKYGLGYIFKTILECLLLKYLCTSHILKNLVNMAGKMKAIHLQTQLTLTEYSTLKHPLDSVVVLIKVY